MPWCFISQIAPDIFLYSCLQPWAYKVSVHCLFTQISPFSTKAFGNSVWAILALHSAEDMHTATSLPVHSCAHQFVAALLSAWITANKLRWQLTVEMKMVKNKSSPNQSAAEYNQYLKCHHQLQQNHQTKENKSSSRSWSYRTSEIYTVL